MAIAWHGFLDWSPMVFAPGLVRVARVARARVPPEAQPSK